MHGHHERPNLASAKAKMTQASVCQVISRPLLLKKPLPPAAWHMAGWWRFLT